MMIAMHTPVPWWVLEKATGIGEIDLGWWVLPMPIITPHGQFRGPVASVSDAEHIDGITTHERDANARLRDARAAIAIAEWGHGVS